MEKRVRGLAELFQSLPEPSFLALRFSRSVSRHYSSNCALRAEKQRRFDLAGKRGNWPIQRTSRQWSAFKEVNRG